MEEDYNNIYFKRKREKLYKRAVRKLFSPLTNVIDGINTDFADRSYARKALISMLKLRAPILVALVLVLTVAAGWFYIESENSATTEMSLNYEESANGLNPNSTRFNAFDFASQEVVENMLAYAGIDKKSVDVNSLMRSISIRPTNARAFSEDNYYISTSYRITLKKPPEIKDMSAKDLLSLLCKAYKDNLYSKYTENRSILGFDIDEFHDEEFLQIADLLDLKAQQIEKYLNTRAKQNKTFTEQESDESFKSLAQKVEDLRTYDISKYRTFVIQAGPSYDRAKYTKALSYVNLIKGIDYKKDMAAYDVRNDGIKLYDESMISVVMIPSIDKSKSTYYMAKTKTGMDYMASQADDYLLTAQETSKEIATNEDIINKMNASSNSADNIQKAKDMINDIRRKFTELSKHIELVDKAYVKYRTKDYVTFKNSNPSIKQKISLDTLVTLAALMLAGIFAVIWLRLRYFSGGDRNEGVSTLTLPLQR